MKKEIIEKASDIIKNSIKENSIDDIVLLINASLTTEKNPQTVKIPDNTIRTAVKSLSKRFDETYLLFFKYDKNKNRIFLETENSLFILFSDEIETLLSQKEMDKEADIINSIKSKAELGYERYFIQNENIVKEFSPDTLEFSFMKKEENETHNSHFVDTLIKMAKMKKEGKNIKGEIKKINAIIPYFPRYVYSEKNRAEFEIFRSLFPKTKDQIIRLEKENIHLENENDHLCAVLIIYLLQ